MSFAAKNRWSARAIVAACLVFVQAVAPAFVGAQATQGATGNPAPAASLAAGFVNSASGVVLVRRGSGKFEPAKPGDLFGPGTIFSTGPDGNAVLVFADGQNITLNKDSLLRIDDFRFDPRNVAASRARLGLLSGIMRLVTGAIHTDNRNGLLVSAGSATVDIISKDTTAFVVEVDPRSQDVGSAAVIVGEIAIDNQTRGPVRIASDQFTRWQLSTPPSAPAPLAAAPAVFQASVAAARATVLGSNLPIDLQAAALQAALSALPPTAAGQPQLQAQAPLPAAVIVPTVTPGGGGGCVGSPC
ncbi:MAG: FecR domain-containing protein [Proteobacteria bacterium]|nr:FecR domain-containing protein [Pseudomonadota bacterium]